VNTTRGRIIMKVPMDNVKKVEWNDNNMFLS
jgi:hypothetical protein